MYILVLEKKFKKLTSSLSDLKPDVSFMKKKGNMVFLECLRNILTYISWSWNTVSVFVSVTANSTL